MADDPLEDYLRELHDIRSSGSAVPETSYYSALAQLFDAVGATLKPKVRCIVNPSHGAGIPDVGLFTPDQFQKASAEEPLSGTKPSRGVIEAKPTSDDAFLTADGAQVSRYWKAYRQVLVTNFRDFLLVGVDFAGNPVKLEHYRLATSEAAFWTAASHPRMVAVEQGDAFVEFLKRVMLHAADLAAPKDVAWFMASYAREALRRVEKKSDVPALADRFRPLPNRPADYSGAASLCVDMTQPYVLPASSLPLSALPFPHLSCGSSAVRRNDLFERHY